MNYRAMLAVSIPYRLVSSSFGRAQLNKAEERVESFGQVIENAWLGRKLLLAAQQEPLITLIDNANVTTVQQQADSVVSQF